MPWWGPSGSRVCKLSSSISPHQSSESLATPASACAPSLTWCGPPLPLQGQYGAAEPMYRQALELRGRVLGPEHPFTIDSINNLAICLNDQVRCMGPTGWKRGLGAAAEGALETRHSAAPPTMEPIDR